jgi:8-oxo-dGTP diphosphatase
LNSGSNSHVARTPENPLGEAYRDPGQADEATFLAAYDPSAFERPSLTVDLVLLTVQDGRLQVLLLERPFHPAAGRLALPGTFVGINESLDAAVARLVDDRIGLEDVFVEQLYTFGAPDRDPRMRIVTVAYYALVAPERLTELADPSLRTATISVPWDGTAGGEVQVEEESGRIRELAFDHAGIIGMAVARLRGKLDYAPVGFQLLPETFTLRRLQAVHETISGHPQNKDSFRRRMLASGDLEATGILENAVGHRPAELYRFARRSAI